MTIIQPDKKLALCSDHAGFELKEQVKQWLDSQNIAYHDFGTYSEESCDYPDFAHPAAEAVEQGQCYPGIAICGTGNGIGITLNKHQGIRAALCWDIELASLARRHNDANFLVMPGRFIAKELALEIVKTFLTTAFEGGRHERRVSKIPVPELLDCMNKK